MPKTTFDPKFSGSIEAALTRALSLTSPDASQLLALREELKALSEQPRSRHEQLLLDICTKSVDDALHRLRK